MIATRKIMNKETSSNLLIEIDVVKEIIKDLDTIINLGEGSEVQGFLYAECSITTSSPGCLLFND